MRILILGINFFPELTGIGKYTGEMSAYLAARGHDVRVVTAPPYYPQWAVQQPYSAWRYESEIWQGVRVYRCPLWVPGRISGLTRVVHLASFSLSSIPPMLAQISWHPELVLAVAPAILSAPAALFVARVCGSKAWLHVQDFEIDAALSLNVMSAPSSLARILCAVERYLLRSFDRVSTISERMCERLTAKGVPAQKIVHFPNWVDTQQVFPSQPDGNPYRQILGLSEHDQVLLYSGNMGQKQGLGILLEAAQLLADASRVHFVLCGDGAERAPLVERARGMSNVHFLATQPLEKLNTLLNLADLHLLPQRADAADLVMPSKLTGILASGKPVIATANAGTEIANVLKDCGAITPPGDAQALASRIRELLGSAAEMARLGRSARQLALTMFDKNEVLSRFASCVESLGQPGEDRPGGL
jgi:colanic acid biosynthesis glycosyl transferase WcaI